jgi:two-component system, OmpR family, KDP operon response regulator KdpE
MKVLVADDDRVQVTQISGRLRSLGYEVVAAYDALQASTAVLRNPPDVIVLDIGMPGGTGVEVLKRLKGSPMTWRIPIVIVSGNEDPEVEKEVRSLGVEDYLRKPADFAKVEEALSRALASRRAAPVE